MSTELTDQSAGELAQRIASREISPIEVVSAHIARIEARNPRLNALVADRFDLAREEARAAEQAVMSKTPLGPLHGVPVTVSECLAVAGAPHSGGSVARSAVIAEKDCTVVTRLRNAGAVVLGVTNTSELSFWVEAKNRVYGATNHPLDIKRTSGGSSGGDAALVASGGTPIAMGVDMAGGVRVPAAFCGVFAHKPSGGLLPLTGFYPMPFGKARRYVTTAPFARSASDLRMMLDVCAGPDRQDKSVVPMQVGDPSVVDFTWKRVILCEDLGIPGLEPDKDVRRALRRAAQILSDEGAEIEEWRPRQFRQASRIWLSMMHEAYGLHNSFRDVLSEGDAMFLPWEMMRLALGRSRHTLPTLGMAVTERFTKGAYVRITNFCAEGRRLRERLQTVLGDGGVMLVPPYPETAPKHNHTRLHMRHFLYSALFNVLDLPVTCAPVGVTKDGMPLGVQVVAQHGRDDVSIAAALAIEKGVNALKPVRRRMGRLRRRS